jgi:hypothetical protein
MDLNTRRGKTRCDHTCEHYRLHESHTVCRPFCVFTMKCTEDGDLCEPVCTAIIDAAFEYTWRHLGTDTEYARLLNALGGEEALQKARNGG